MKRKKLLIISKEQFGYHTDIYKWCEYLRSIYEIEVVCFGGKPRVYLQDVEVHYVSSKGSRSIKGIRYMLASLYRIILFRGLIIVCNFSGCKFFKTVCPKKKMLLDIRSLGISPNEKARIVENQKTKATTDKYDYITIISEGTREKIGLSKEKSAILPLGADIVSHTNKEFNTLRLLYVGTLQDRDIDKTIKGVAQFLERYPNTNLTYDIIGAGYDNEVERYIQLTRELGVDKNVRLHGYIQHDKLKNFYDNCNIGVSFVPVTEYYDYQPVTKTYEYVLSGLYTIATNTISNKQIVNSQNGVLIDDTIESFAFAIEHIINNSRNIDSERIRSTLYSSQWEMIVRNTMLPILKETEKRFSL